MYIYLCVLCVCYILTVLYIQYSSPVYTFPKDDILYFRLILSPPEYSTNASPQTQI